MIKPAPVRVQLSRRKGWRMPANTIKVDRTTPWGNPFAPGAFGNRAYCVLNFARTLGGLIDLGGGVGCFDAQDRLLKRLREEMKQRYPSLRGKNLACWCSGWPCHADLLLILANNSRKIASRLIDEYCNTHCKDEP